jgi:solute carrier family 66 (lysosomal lysine-arginine transporter), member 1
VPTVIALAVYFCLADFVLISQCLYYNFINARRARRASQATTIAAGERDPLLAGLERQSSEGSTIGLPGSRRRRRSSSSTITRGDGQTGGSQQMEQILEEDDYANGEGWVRNTVSVLLVCAVGSIGWVLAWKGGIWVPAAGEGEDIERTEMAVGAQILGYISAVCYLG